MANIPLSGAIAKLQKSNPAYAFAVGLLLGKDGPEKELAQAYIDMYSKYHELSMDYVTLHREACKLSAENEFMVKTLNEESNK